MKVMNVSEFRVQSSNKHLKNILEEGYYIELGCINYKTLSRLLSGEEITIEATSAKTGKTFTVKGKLENQVYNNRKSHVWKDLRD